MRFNVIGLGEVLWDLLPAGPQLGGAPTNFVCHAHALSANARLISRIGRDEWGRKTIEALERLGVPTDCIETDPTLPTGTVTVAVDREGQPNFTIHEQVAWDALHGEPAGRAAMADADAVCFGTLAQRSKPSRSTIRSLLALAPATALRILDVNLRQHYFSSRLIEESLVLANVLKVNDAELPRLAEMLGLKGDVRSQITELAVRYNLRAVACTRGGRGSLLHSAGQWSDHPGIAAKVVDTVGAGDAFTAAMTLGLLAGWDLDRINKNASQVAAYVCSCAGATPPLPSQLRDMFEPTSRE